MFFRFACEAIKVFLLKIRPSLPFDLFTCLATNANRWEMWVCAASRQNFILQITVRHVLIWWTTFFFSIFFLCELRVIHTYIHTCRCIYLQIDIKNFCHKYNCALKKESLSPRLFNLLSFFVCLVSLTTDIPFGIHTLAHIGFLPFPSSKYVAVMPIVLVKSFRVFFFFFLLLEAFVI